MKQNGFSKIVAIGVLVLTAAVAINHLTAPSAQAALGDPPAQEKVVGPRTLPLGNGVNTNGVAASTTQTFSNNIAVVSLLDGDTDIGVDFSASLHDAGTANTTIKFARCLSTNQLETTPGVTLTFAQTGTTTVNCFTNINLQNSSIGRGCPYLVLYSLQNGNTSTLQNVKLRTMRIPANRCTPYPSFNTP